jgi:hypothetical protein
MMKSNLKILGTAITIWTIISVAAIALSTTSSTASQSGKDHLATDIQTGHPETLLRPVYDLNDIGRDATLSEVTDSLRLGRPTYLPSGTSLPQARLRDDNSIAAIIYTNPDLQRLSGYKQSVQIVILAQRDGTSFESFERFLSARSQPTITVIDKDGNTYTTNATEHVIGMNRSRLVSVAGNPGYGYDPMHTPVQDNGQVQWWSKEGIHYYVIANLPLQELVKIAESMQA